jgi:hypothetical protein
LIIGSYWAAKYSSESDANPPPGFYALFYMASL